jgi:hypothetical protein
VKVSEDRPCGRKSAFLSASSCGHGSLILPELHRRGRNEALRPLLMFHPFRFVGLAFLVPGVVSPDLPAAFAEGATYGDIVAVALALLTLAISPWTRRTTRSPVSFLRSWPNLPFDRSAGIPPAS